jgi:glycosyltransferase involved in cell wall biosynthesis
MAAGTPVVSTAVGAEGLDVADGNNLYLADSPRDFADRCLRLLEDAGDRERLARAAWDMVAKRHSWDVVARGMERLLFD